MNEGRQPEFAPRPPGWWHRQEAATKVLLGALSVVAAALLAVAIVLCVLLASSEPQVANVSAGPNVTEASVPPMQAPETTTTVAPATTASTEPVTTTSIGAATTTSVPPTTATLGSQVGRGVAIAAVVWTVTEVKYPENLQSNNSFHDPKVAKSEQGKFVLVLMSLENKGKEPISFSPNALKLMDSEGRSFDYWNDYMWYVPEEYDEWNEINPGFKGKAALIFEVPKDATGFTLLAKDPGDLWGDNEVSIDLGQ